MTRRNRFRPFTVVAGELEREGKALLSAGKREEGVALLIRALNATKKGDMFSHGCERLQALIVEHGGAIPPVPEKPAVECGPLAISAGDEAAEIAGISRSPESYQHMSDALYGKAGR